jgi:hypothetical protein
MQDAKYFRAQAAFCLEIAAQMSDPHAAARLRADAAMYHAMAVKFEKEDDGFEPWKT